MDQGSFRPGGWSILPPVIKNLLIINVIFFLATITFEGSFNINLTDLLGLHYFAAEKFQPYQLITHMFMHGGFAHILFNMFALWMLGRVLENVWGQKKFLFYYIFAGLGAAVTHYVVFYFQMAPTLELMNTFLDNPSSNALNALVNEHTFQINQYSGEIYQQFQSFRESYQTIKSNPGDLTAMQNAIDFLTNYKQYYLNLPNVIGASGAVFGVLLAFGMLFPNAVLYIYFAIPIKAKYFVIILGAIELYSGFVDTGSNVAHFAHLGGMIFGFILLKYWQLKHKLYV